MKKILSKIFASDIIGTVIVIALGLLLTFYPDVVVDTVCYIFGAICLLAAGFYLYRSITGEHKVVSSFSALAYLALGVIFIFFAKEIFEALPLTAGICLLVFSLLKLYTAFTFLKSNVALFKKMLVPPAINAILGIVLILMRGAEDVLVVRVIGVILLYCACEGIVTKLIIKADSRFPEKAVTQDDSSSSKDRSLQVKGEFSDPDLTDSDDTGKDIKTQE